MIKTVSADFLTQITQSITAVLYYLFFAFMIHRFEYSSHLKRQITIVSITSLSF